MGRLGTCLVSLAWSARPGPTQRCTNPCMQPWTRTEQMAIRWTPQDLEYGLCPTRPDGSGRSLEHSMLGLCDPKHVLYKYNPVCALYHTP